MRVRGDGREPKSRQGEQGKGLDPSPCVPKPKISTSELWFRGLRWFFPKISTRDRTHARNRHERWFFRPMPAVKVEKTHRSSRNVTHGTHPTRSSTQHSINLCLCASLARRLARPRKIERRRAHTHTHARARARAHTHTHTHTTHTCPERGSTAARTGRRVHRIRDARAQPPRRPCACARVPRLSAESRRLRCSARGSASPRS